MPTPAVDCFYQHCRAEKAPLLPTSSSAGPREGADLDLALHPITGPRRLTRRSGPAVQRYFSTAARSGAGRTAALCAAGSLGPMPEPPQAAPGPAGGACAAAPRKEAVGRAGCWAEPRWGCGTGGAGRGGGMSLAE